MLRRLYLWAFGWTGIWRPDDEEIRRARDIRKVAVALVVFALLGLVALNFYADGSATSIGDQKHARLVLSLSIQVALGSAGVALVLGFLFGIPKSRGDGGPGEEPPDEGSDAATAHRRRARRTRRSRPRRSKRSAPFDRRTAAPPSSPEADAPHHPACCRDPNRARRSH